MNHALELDNGVTMPALGFGVFQTPPDETVTAVETALRTGYRHIDTAAAYLNEREVGEAIRRSGLPRDEVFIETKVWISDYGNDETLHAFDKSTGKLGVDTLDLLSLPPPRPVYFDRTIAAYRARETLLADGKVRAIGVSNFMPDHLETLLDATTIVPAVNQVELHPYFAQPEVQAADAAHGILTQAWSPIGGITFYRGGAAGTLADPVIGGIAAEHGRSPAQVMLRRHLQQGRPLGHPEVGAARAHRREPRRLRHRADAGGARGHRRARHRRARRPRSGLDHARDLRAHHPRGVNATRHPLDDGYSPSAISLIAARRRSHSAPMASSRRAVALSSAPTTR